MGDGHRLGGLGEVGACPARKGVASLGRVIQREVVGRNIICGGVGRDHAAAIEVVSDVVGDEGPVSRVAAVAHRALGDGHRLGGFGEVGARPARKGVASLGRIIQGEGIGRNIVGGGVGRGHTAAVEGVGDGVGDETGRGVHRGIVVGGHGEGVAAEGGAIEAVGHLIACGRVVVAQGDGGVAGVVGGVLVGDALARGGDIRILYGERMHTACTGHVLVGASVTYAHIDGIGRTVHGAVAVVVGGEGAAVAPDEGTYVGVAASDGRTDDEAVLHRSPNIITHKSANVSITRDAGVGEDDVLDDGTGADSAEKCYVLVRIAGIVGVFVNADAADGIALAVVGAAEVLVAARAVDDDVAADLGEVVLGGAAAVVVGDVSGLLEGEAAAAVGGNVHKEGEAVKVVLVGNLVGVVAEAVEVVEVHVADGVGARQGAVVIARSRDGDGGGAWAVVVGVAHGVVDVWGEHRSVVGDGGFRRNGTTLVDISRVDAADDGVAVAEGLVGHIVNDDSAESLVRRDGDGERMVVAARRGGATRNVGAAFCLDRGAIEPQRAAFDGHRERGGSDDVGHLGPLLEVERAVEGDVGRLLSPMDYMSVIEGVAGTLPKGNLLNLPKRLDGKGIVIVSRHALYHDTRLVYGMCHKPCGEHQQ